MILRRITSHLKDQNWFAVCLDLSIVVGVFIGIQVANWNIQMLLTDLGRFRESPKADDVF